MKKVQMALSSFQKLFIIFGLLFSSTQTHAFIPTVTSSGTPIRWKGHIKMNLAGNPLNTSDLQPGQIFDGVVMGLQRWKRASSGNVEFDYWQGEDSNIYPPTSQFDGLSTLYFSSQAGSAKLSPNVLGMTQVWYNTDTGEALEADIILNDINFQFTNNPKDTSGYGAGSSTFTGGKSNVFIQNVITHELGHALGLSHSGSLQSTMLFMESPEQAHLGCDEIVAIQSIYPSSGEAPRGYLTGKVTTQEGAPLFGAHVLAISQNRGTVLASAITDQTGRYYFTSLEQGTYFLMAEPFFAGSTALPLFYASVNSAVCSGGTSYGRTFLTQSDDFRLQTLSVASEKVTEAPTLATRCTGPRTAAVQGTTNSHSLNTAPVLSFVGQDSTGMGIVDKARPGSVNYYRLTGVGGRISIHTVSYGLYSPIQPTLTLLRQDGTAVPAHSADPVYVGDSGFINRDSALSVENLEFGDYIIRVSSSQLSATLYPAGPIALDSVPFLVLSISLNQDSPPLTSLLPSNIRCRMTESFGAYSSPPGNPPRRDISKDEKGTGFCGTIRNYSDDSSDSDSNGPSPSVIIGWFLPWMWMILIIRLLIFLHRHPIAATLKLR